jgi:hypothetical protein
VELRVRFAAAFIALLFTSLLAEELFWNKPAEAKHGYSVSSGQITTALASSAVFAVPAHNINASATDISSSTDITVSPAVSEANWSPIVQAAPTKKQPQRLLEMTDNGWVFNGTAKKKNKKS